jgi:hypothetical protein
VPVADTCNPRYSGGRDKEDCGLKTTRAMTFYLKKIHHKKGLVEWLKVKALSSSSSTPHPPKKGKPRRMEEVWHPAEGFCVLFSPSVCARQMFQIRLILRTCVVSHEGSRQGQGE